MKNLLMGIGIVFAIWLILSLPWTSSLLMQEWRPTKILQGIKAQGRLGCGPNKPCPENSYCYEQICLGINELELKHYSTSPNSFVGCNQPHDFNVTLSIENHPDNFIVTSKTLILNGSMQVSIRDCWESGERIYCNLTLPTLPNCGEGSYLLSPNIINFTVDFTDEAGTSFTRTLTTQISDINIQSWICGDGQCQQDLGESQQNCCCDCGCPDDYYCDRDIGCMPEPSSFDFILKSASSTKAIFDLRIDNAPKDLSIDILLYNFDCLKAEIAHCDILQTSISCQPGTWSSGTYQTECEFDYQIPDYESTVDFLIDFDLNLTLHYSDCETPVEKLLSKHISFALNKQYCGNGIPEPEIGETSSSCCLDVPCPAGQYCDLADYEIDLILSNQRSPKDFGDAFKNRCRSLDAFRIKQISAEKAVAYTSVSQGYRTIMPEFNVTLEFEGVPESLKDVSRASCTLDQGLRQDCTDTSRCCQVERCWINGSKVICQVRSLPILLIHQVPAGHFSIQLDLSLKFNNGTQEIEKSFQGTTNFELEVRPKCGNGWLEEDLGESIENCCQDAELFGYSCEYGLTCVPEIGKCVNLSAIDGFLKLPEGPQSCEHSFAEAECVFDTSIEIVSTHPKDINVSLENVKILIGEKNYQTSCEEAERIESGTVFKCDISGNLNETQEAKNAMDSAARGKCGGCTYEQTAPVLVNFSLVPVAGGQPQSQAIFKSETGQLTFKIKFPEAVKQCWEYMDDVNDELDDIEDEGEELQRWIDVFLGLLVIGWIIKAACAVACAFGERDCCPGGTTYKVAVWMICIGGAASCALNFYKSLVYDPSAHLEKAEREYSELGEKCGSALGYDIVNQQLEDLYNEIYDIQEDYNEIISKETLKDLLIDLAACGSAYSACSPLVKPLIDKLKNINPVVEQGEAGKLKKIFKNLFEFSAGKEAGKELIKKAAEEAIKEKAEEEYFEYTVQKGDTLWDLAQKYGTTVEDIQKLNSEITDPNRIYVGQKIKIPKSKG